MTRLLIGLVRLAYQALRYVALVALVLGWLCFDGVVIAHGLPGTGAFWQHCLGHVAATVMGVVDYVIAPVVGARHLGADALHLYRVTVRPFRRMPDVTDGVD
ncbi:MAG: hypothetical protein WDM91_18995 [Rhizomicrobium sp.]